MNNYLLDTNILIYLSHGQPQYLKLLQGLNKALFHISVTSYIEFMLGAKNNTEKRAFEKYLNTFKIIEIDKVIADKAVEYLSQSYKLSTRNSKFADIVIASTANVHKMPLITNNPSDFTKYAEIEIITAA